MPNLNNLIAKNNAKIQRNKNIALAILAFLAFTLMALGGN